MQRLHRALPAALLLAAVLLVPTSLAGQGQGALAGSVTDALGDALPEVNVRATGPGGAVRGTLTDGTGGYRIEGASPGRWRVRATRVGFAPATFEVTVPAGGLGRADFRLLRQAVVLEGITATGRAATERERVRFETEAGVTSRVLEGEELKLLPGLGEADVIRAVELLPGVVSTSDFSGAYHVRGGSADQNLILLDGFPLFNPFHLGGLFSVFNSDVVTRAELLSGGFGAEYGGRVSSVLDIEGGPAEPDEAGLHGDAGVSILAARLALHSPLPESMGSALGGERGSWYVSGRRSYLDQLLAPVQDFPYRLTDLQGGVVLGTRGGGRLRLVGYTGDDLLDLSDFDPPGDAEVSEVLRVRWGWGNDLLGATLEQPVGGWSSVSRLGVSRYGEGLTFVDFGDTRFESRITQWTAGTVWSRGIGSGVGITVGAEANRVAYRNFAEAGGTSFFDDGDRGALGAAFASVRWRPGEAWIVEPGVRADAWSSDRSTRATLSPRLAVKRFFGAGGDVALKVALGRYTQFLHSLRDENLPVSNDRWIAAGPYVPPVVSDQFQIGIEGFRGDVWQASAEAYLRTFDGVIDFNLAEDPNRPDDDFLVGRGRSYGLDLLLRKRQGALTGWTAVSLLSAERTFPDPLAAGFEDLPQEVSYTPIFDRRVDAELVLRYELPWKLDGGLHWNYGSGIPFTRPVAQYDGWEYDLLRGGYKPGELFGGDGPLTVVLGPRNGQRYPAYHRLDVTLRRPFQPRWGTLTPYLQLLNAYDQRNVLFHFYRYDRTPPTRAGFSMFPFLPAFGVEASF
ncbi:TonB-dependent receptor [soil metagenome]